MTDIRHTNIPTTTYAAPRQLLRRTFHPYGKEGLSFSVSLREGREGAEYVLTKREPGAKAPTVLFQGRVILGSDLDQTASEVLEVLTLTPGDGEGHDFTDYTPEQLDFAVQHARILRQVVGERLAWNYAKINPRMDLGELTYRKRAIGDLRHRFQAGVIDVSARTRKDAKQGFTEAVRNHLSALPSFAKNEAGSIFACFPRGSEWVIQPLHPHQAEWVGPAYAFAARSPEEAEAELARVVNQTHEKPKSRVSGKSRSTGPVIGVRA